MIITKMKIVKIINKIDSYNSTLSSENNKMKYCKVSSYELKDFAFS